jgi:endonuclease/exonuclease/phosphatase family metal-dependent hydrolase
LQVPVHVDGEFMEWPVQQGTSSLRAASDSDGVYVYFQLANPVVFQAEANLALYFDTDGDAGTGLDGFELRWDAGSQSGTEFNAAGSPAGQVGHSDIGLVVAPTIDSDAFELVLSRSVFSASATRIKVEHTSTSFSEVIHLELSDTAFASTRDGSRPDFTDVRLLSYNVRFDGLWDSDLRSDFETEIASFQADIIAFQEIYSYTANETLQWVQGVDGSFAHAVNNADCHIISKHPIADSWSLDGNLAARISLASGEELMLINVHLPCCSSVGGRQSEMSTIEDFIADIRQGNVANVSTNIPILAVGDFNLVDADSANIASFEAGTGLTRTRFLQLNRNISSTWENPGSSFSPGQLDWMFISEGLIALNNFVAKGSQPSDHLPIVIDLGFDTDTDLLPDSWEQFFFSDLSASTFGDPDTDLLDNRSEFLLGSSPIVASIPPAITLSTLPSGLISLQWTTRYTTQYALDRADTPSTWQPVDWGLNGHQGTFEVLVDGETLGHPSFFRLGME